MGESDLYLRTIWVDDWNAPVLHQFDIHSLPHLILYDDKEKADEGWPSVLYNIGFLKPQSGKY